MNHSFVFLVVLLTSSSSSFTSGRNTIHAFAPSAPLTQQRQPSQTVQSHRNFHHHHHHHSHRHPRHLLQPQTQLKMSSSSSSDLPEASSMRVKELRAELQSYGISTKSFFEKSELVEAVVKARKEGATAVGGADAGSSSSASSGGGDSGSSTASSSSSSSSSSSTGSSRATQLAKEIEKCKSMKVSELKSELASYGISTKSFFEKSEFVRACAEARVDGSSRKSAGGGGASGVQQEEYDPSYRDVAMKKMSPEQVAQMGQGFGGGGFGASKTSTIDIRLG